MSVPNLEIWADWDQAGAWRLNIRKRRGKLTLEEIKDACTDYEQDFYLLVICAMDCDTYQYYDVDDLTGDYVQLYRANDFFAWRIKDDS